uniref:Uncharacterized protein n=1 Tax=Compsopogon caeruleus TaxID=31354 RepID=A0A7S1TBD5_9RHOD|mmetsp:Transcript_14810/g.30140  ORF Transcript_14810/g.30140 Transcript_14810/m.30140 type:complete len:583 (+) Transcript_14810:101-1849(+)
MLGSTSRIRKGVSEKPALARYLPLRIRRVWNLGYRFLRDNEDWWVVKWIRRYVQVSLLVKCLLLVSLMGFQVMRMTGAREEGFHGGVTLNASRYQILVLSKGDVPAMEQMLVALDGAEYANERVDVHFFVPSEIWSALFRRRQISQLIPSLRWQTGKKFIHWISSAHSILDRIPTGEEPIIATSLLVVRPPTLLLAENVHLSPSFFIWLKTAAIEFRERTDVCGFALEESQSAGHDIEPTISTNWATFGSRAPNLMAFAMDTERWSAFLNWTHDHNTFHFGAVELQTLYAQFCREHRLWIVSPSLGRQGVIVTSYPAFGRPQPPQRMAILDSKGLSTAVENARETFNHNITAYSTLQGTELQMNRLWSALEVHLTGQKRIASLLLVDEKVFAKAREWLKFTSKNLESPPLLILLCANEDFCTRLQTSSVVGKLITPGGLDLEGYASEITCFLIDRGVSVLRLRLSLQWDPKLVPLLEAAKSDIVIPGSSQAFSLYVRPTLATHCAFVSIRRQRAWLRSKIEEGIVHGQEALGDEDMVKWILRPPASRQDHAKIPKHAVDSLHHFQHSLTWFSNRNRLVASKI